MTQKETIISLIVLLTSILSFLIGFSSGRESGIKGPKIIFTDVDRAGILAAAATLSKDNQNTDRQAIGSGVASSKKTTIFGSKNGTKYYYSWCKSGNRIKSSNRVYFESSTQAEIAGRSIAANCK